MTNHIRTFGNVLARIRKAQGFPSAYQFFKNVGGSKIVGCAYVSYWDMERGKKLPKSWRFKAIMAALGAVPDSAAARELVRAYFMALSSSDDLVRILSLPPSAAADLPTRELAEAATQKVMTQFSARLTLEQWELSTRELVTDICNTYLANTAGWVTVRELTDATQFKPAAIKKALKTLATGGLLDLSGDKARSRFPGKSVQLLPMTPVTAPIRALVRKNCETWLAGVKPVIRKRLTFRMSKANLEIYRQHLEKAMSLAAIYCNAEEDRRDSAIYFADVGIYPFIPKG